MSSWAEKISLASGDSIILYRAQNFDGRDFFAYLRCNAEGFKRMQLDHQLKKIVDDINIYGSMIYLDFIKDPDAKAAAFLASYLAANS